MRYAIGALVIFAGSAMANSDNITMEYENFSMTQTGAAEIVLKITNIGTTEATFVKAECALLGADQKALTTVSVIAQNIPAGGHGYAHNFGQPGIPVKHADCRVVTVDRR